MSRPSPRRLVDRGRDTGIPRIRAEPEVWKNHVQSKAHGKRKKMRVSCLVDCGTACGCGLWLWPVACEAAIPAQVPSIPSAGAHAPRSRYRRRS